MKLSKHPSKFMIDVGNYRSIMVQSHIYITNIVGGIAFTDVFIKIECLDNGLYDSHTCIVN